MAKNLPLGLQTQEKRLGEILSGLTNMAAGQLNQRLPLSGARDELDAIAGGVNVLAEEFTHSLKRLEEQTLAADKANQAKSYFLARMSHEIRTPLAALIGFTEILLDNNLSEDTRREYLIRLQRNGTALRKLVDDILDVSKAESQGDRYTKSEMPLRRCLTEAVESFEALAKAKHNTLALHFEDNVPQLIQSDPLRIWQVMNNLLGNAVKFTENGRIDIRVCVPTKELVQVEVEDTGMGIAPEDQRSLFQEFSQASSLISKQYGGSGLGLLLSRTICQAMGGNVVLLRSALGHGSSFRATFRFDAMKQAVL